MYKTIKLFAFGLLVTAMSAAAANAQTERKVTINSDGSYTVVEYPVDKNVEVRLVPMTGINGTALAHVHRTAAGTKVMVHVNGAPADWKDVYAYAVDPTGASTFLGPVAVSNGSGKAEFTTPGNQFMIVLSPNQGLTAYDPSTAYVFRSEVPAGFTVVPRSKMKADSMVASSVIVAPTYNVPMLGIARSKGNESETRLKFESGELAGLEAKAFLKPVNGKTEITMKFSDLQKVPRDTRFVLWTSGPEGYTKVGQIMVTGSADTRKDTAQIRGETALSDFGLFMTVEDAEVVRPTGKIYSTFTIVP